MAETTGNTTETQATGTTEQTNGAEGNQSQQAQSAAAPQIDYEKLESLITKNVSVKENTVIKSYFEQQGMSEEEAKEAMKTYKAEKASKAQNQTETLKTIQQENAQLRAQILQGKIERNATTVALDIGISKDRIPYVIKMADLSKVVDDKGEIAEDLLKEAIEKVTTDIPELKASATENKGFVQVGADGNNQGQLEDDMLRKAAGLPPKKK